MNNENRIRDVYSLNLICYLRLKGIEKREVGWNDYTKKVYYIYEPTIAFDEAVEMYRDEETVVGLRGFITGFKDVKEEISIYKRKFEESL